MTKKFLMTHIAALFFILVFIFVFISISVGTQSEKVMAPIRSAIVPQASAQSVISTTTPQSADTSISVAPGKPARIIIPTAKVDTDVIPVGVTSTNNLDVPKNYVQVGWYQYGPMPGQPGSAVLDGHVDNGSTVPGPFKHLRDVKVGDDVQITDDKGNIRHFTVISSDVYETKQFPSEAIFYGGSGTLIKLITCHGTFVPSEHTYNERLVVTAILTSS